VRNPKGILAPLEKEIAQLQSEIKTAVQNADKK